MIDAPAIVGSVPDRDDPFPGLGEPYGYVKKDRFCRKFANKVEKWAKRPEPFVEPLLPYGGPVKESPTMREVYQPDEAGSSEATGG